MTGVELSLLISQLAGPALAGLFGDNGQERQSFAGEGSADPRTLMRNNVDMTTRLGDALTTRLAQPVNLRSAVAQTPGSYSGGGLPFPIGVTAEDPALADPSLLSLPGISGLEGLFNGSLTAQGTPDSSVNPDTGYDDGGLPPPGALDRIAVPKRESASPSTAGPRRRSDSEYGQLVRADDLFDEPAPGDDLNKALGSVQLLMEAFR